MGEGGGHQIRVLLVVVHVLLGEVLAYALGQEREFELVGLCERGGERLRLGLDQNPTVVVLGLEDGVGPSEQLLNQLKIAQGPAAILVIGSSLNDSEVRRLVQSGVRGIIPWERPLTELVRAIRAVADGESWFDQEHLLAVLWPGRRRTGRSRPAASA